MPTSEKNANVESAAGQVPEVAARAAQTAVNGSTVAVPADVPDTAATRAVWAALTAHPGATPGDLAEMAGVNRSTANKALSAMEEAGCATRTAGGREGGKRLPDRWQAVTAEEEPAGADESAPEPSAAEADASAPEAEQREPADAALAAEDAGAESPSDGGQEADSSAADQPAEATAAGASGRLRPGALRDMVIDYLRQRPNQEFSPSAIGKALERSSGAVANSLEKLTSDGVVKQTNEKPRRYRYLAAGRKAD